MHSEHSARMKVAAIILWTGTTSQVCESSVVQKSSAWTFQCRDNQPSLWSFKFFKSIVDAQKRLSWRHNFRSAHCLRRSSCCWRYTWNASLEGKHGMIIPSVLVGKKRKIQEYEVPKQSFENAITLHHRYHLETNWRPCLVGTMEHQILLVHKLSAI